MASRDTIRERFISGGSIDARALGGAIVASGIATWLALTAKGAATAIDILASVVIGPLEFFREVLLAGPSIATANIEAVAERTLAFYPVTGPLDFALGVLTVVAMYAVVTGGWWLVRRVL